MNASHDMRRAKKNRKRNTPCRHADLRRAPLAAGLALIVSGSFFNLDAIARTIPNTAQPQPMARPGARQLRQDIRALRPTLHTTVTPRPSAILTVTSCADDSDAGTLRNTIAAAVDGDTVDLSALTCSSITLVSGAIPVNLDNLVIHGAGTSALVISGAGMDRVLIHPGSGTLGLQGVKIVGGRIIRSGNQVTGGGCIASAGDVVLDHSAVLGCFAAAVGVYGGAIIANTLTMQASTLSDNTASGTHPSNNTATFGGGAYVYSLSLLNSTVSGNRAQRDPGNSQSSYDTGGGIFTDYGGIILNSTIDSNYSTTHGGGISSFSGLTVLNSTVSGNTAQTDFGGGVNVRLLSDFNLRNSTITANHARDGGGVWLWTPIAISDFQSSIVAGNTAAPGNAADLSSSSALSVGGSNNLVDLSNITITLPADTLHGDPRLLPLDHNDGSTRTHALDVGSPALNAGNNLAGFSTDQRGFPRVSGIRADIGAFEDQAVSPPEPIPTGGRWLLGSLGMLLGWIGWRKLRTQGR